MKIAYHTLHQQKQQTKRLIINKKGAKRDLAKNNRRNGSTDIWRGKESR